MGHATDADGFEQRRRWDICTVVSENVAVQIEAMMELHIGHGTARGVTTDANICQHRLPCYGGRLIIKSRL